jgi:hypothetical protein
LRDDLDASFFFEGAATAMTPAARAHLPRRLVPLLLCLPLSACTCSEEPAEATAAPDDAAADRDRPEVVADALDEPLVDADAPAGPTETAGSCGPVRWARAYGAGTPGVLTASEAAKGLALDAGGRLLVTGYYRGAASFGGDPLPSAGSNRAMFVLALDPDGRHVFSRGFGDPGAGLFYTAQVRGEAVAARAGGGSIVVGALAGTVDFGTGDVASKDELQEAGFSCFHCSSDALVLALDANGETLWARAFGDLDGDAATAVAVGADDSIYVAGGFQGTLELGAGITLTSAGKTDGFVIKLDADGELLWARRFGGSGEDSALALALSSGKLHAAGSFASSADFGTRTLSASGESDGFWLALDEAGELLDARALGASQHGFVTALATRAGGELLLAGAARGKVGLLGGAQTSYTDAFVAALDPAGAVAWSKLFGTYENDSASALALTPLGRVLVAGSLGVGQADLGGGPLAYDRYDSGFLLELDERGNHLCSRRWQPVPRGEPIGDSATASIGAGIDLVSALYDGEGNAFVAGAITGRATLSGVAAESSGGQDGLVVGVGQ